MRTAIVTGASRGIGLAIAKQLSLSYNVISISRTPSPVGRSILFDLTKLHDFEALFQQIIQAEGSAPATILINCAGIVSSKLGIHQNLETIQTTLNLNLVAPMMLSKHLLKQMIKQKNGLIVNIASVVGNTKFPSGLGAYSASKAGLIAFTKTMANEVASRNVRVNAIAPGYIDSDMISGLTVPPIPLKRLGSPEEVAATVQFIIDNEYITGQCFVIDGGLSI